ncbi:DUF488 family protein [Dechloromonas sp.]|uniref:DUF488 domain-containing protein n=1 Tax=Dechloromonas sp. TaxID=1917218 RepID=UPI002171B2D8|nr:DUF488 domain-containing protein [Dechloromonas sp.]MBU3696543.1 DUF488 domain-containing protein [Dechloromonas sp.]
MTITINTIGFTRKSASEFFDLLTAAKVRRVIDIRLNNTSQLAGFAKRDDLSFFLKRIAGIDYRHEPLLAPSEKILSDFKQGKIDWSGYERQFKELMHARQIAARFEPSLFDGACLLCSEETANFCHRRLVAEYLLNHWGGVTIVHLR